MTGILSSEAREDLRNRAEAMRQEADRIEREADPCPSWCDGTHELSDPKCNYDIHTSVNVLLDIEGCGDGSRVWICAESLRDQGAVVKQVCFDGWVPDTLTATQARAFGKALTAHADLIEGRATLVHR